MIKLRQSTFHKEVQTKKRLAEFIINAPILSMNKQCKLFEKNFSQFQQRKHAVMFNSGSSANLALIQAMINMDKIQPGDYVAFSALTWSTNIMPIIQLGLKPIPVDVTMKTLNCSLSDVQTAHKKHPHIKVFFITNALGFCDKLDKIQDYCEQNDILLLEDNCESLGSVYKQKKLGNFSLASTFSFFVGHHLSTIEGGMVCTDDEDLFHMLSMVREHGWTRDLPDHKKKEIHDKHDIDSFYEKYSFFELGYNLRPSEINGFIGNEQIPHVNHFCEQRHINFHQLQEFAKQNKYIYHLDTSHMDLVSNFAFPIVFKDKVKMEEYKQKFNEANIEIRPIIGGAIPNQPFFKKHGVHEHPIADLIHKQGFYIPNHEELTQENILQMRALLK